MKSKAKKPKIKVVFNIWGNYACFIGSRREETYYSEYDAKRWLVDMMATGRYVLSDKNYMTDYLK